MQLDLVDRGQLAGLGHEPFEMGGEEVRHPDGADPAAVTQLEQGPPGLDLSLIHI